MNDTQLKKHLAKHADAIKELRARVKQFVALRNEVFNRFGLSTHDAISVPITKLSAVSTVFDNKHKLDEPEFVSISRDNPDFVDVSWDVFNTVTESFHVDLLTSYAEKQGYILELEYYLNEEYYRHRKVN